MSKMGDHVIKLQEIPVFIDCPQCGGTGEMEVDEYKPQSFSRDVGEIYTTLEECDLCLGNGEIEKPCDECGETMTMWDGTEASVCRECREEGYGS